MQKAQFIINKADLGKSRFKHVVCRIIKGNPTTQSKVY